MVERVVGNVFVPWLQNNGFGDRQYAYSKGRSHRDVLAANVCDWILAFENDCAVGLYCSDVSGAFDRVCRQRMSEKLRASGLPDNVVRFLESWLEDRRSYVVVAGGESASTVLANSVFQGTVLGPPLWNTFYGDARWSVRRLGFVESIFADDFNCWVVIDRDTDSDTAFAVLSMGQFELHEWGRANRVTFDPAKEAFVLLRRRDAVGQDFKLLGLTFDPQLLMHRGARKIATEAGWRLSSILRSAKFFSTPEVFRLYKAYVLSYIESSMTGYYHAADSTLMCIDRIQSRFLRAMDMSEVDAIVRFRLAPLKLRRDIGILGFLHRVTLGLVSPQLQALFPKAGRRALAPGIAGRSRLARRYHDKQLVDRVTRSSTVLFCNSIFGMVECYNSLPQRLVDLPNVSVFQRALQASCAQRAKEGYGQWQQIFSEGRKYSSLIRFQAFFG